MNIEHLLHVEIADEFEALSNMKKGSDEHRTMVDEVTKLLDRAIEMEKLDIENEDKTKTREEDRKDRLIKNILAGAGIVIPTLVTIWGTCKSIKFEENGTITTIMGRGFIQKLLPKK